MGTIYCRIRGQELNLSIPTPVVANTIDYISVNGMFTDDWKNAVKWVYFHQDGRVYKIMMQDDNIAADKHLNLAPGKWNIWVMGDIIAHGNISTRITTNVVEFTVLESGLIDGNVLAVPPDVGEQILAIAVGAMEKADETAEKMTYFEYRANRGDFDGKQGPQGVPGPQGQTGPQGEQGESGVYVGSGDIPAGYNVQIDPEGEATVILEDAPEDGKQYARQDGEWTEVIGGGGGASDVAWLPDVDTSGNISWQRSTTTTPPTTRNIKGPKGETGLQGPQGEQGESGVYVGSGTIPEGYNVKINPTGHAVEFVDEAPDDGKQYARQNKQWTEVIGGGGVTSDIAWLPTVDASGNLSWQRSSSTTAPTTRNIKGPQGIQGTPGTNGTDGTNGEDGVSPAVTVTTITGGHRVTITDAEHPAGQSFDVLNGSGSTSRWEDKNILVIGDSASDTAEHDHPWQETFATALGCTVTTHAKWGATLLDMINGSQSIGISALTQQDVTGKDLIILFGGGNDIEHEVPIGQVGDLITGSLCGNLYYAISRIYSLLSSANNLGCRVMLISYYNVGTSPYDERPTQAIEDTAHWLGLPCVNLRKTSGINQWTWSMYGRNDNEHLTTAGNNLIGGQIAQFVESEV